MAIPIVDDPYSNNTSALIWTSLDNLEPIYAFYRPESLDSICAKTKFSKKEAQLIYRSFKQGCPNGIVNLKQFQEIFAQFFLRDGDQKISFEIFVICLSVITRGTLAEKFHWIFTLYDIERRDSIGQHEILTVTQAIYELLGRKATPIVTKGHVIDHVIDVYNKLCTNGDTQIGRRKFVEMCLDSKDICESLDRFNTIF
uniref:Uncharacterized protein n=1 Tax=Ditylenchus dipsaci TaxID=166011 RepID=A0A915D6T8_9BILA